MESNIQNTQIHTYQGMLIQPFGVEGAAVLTPFDNDRPGRAIILDRFSVDLLVESLVSIQCDAQASL